MWSLEHLHLDMMGEAAGVLAMRGYENAHAADLARASRLSVGSLYRRYGSKHRFALAVRDFAEDNLCYRARREFEHVLRQPGADFREAFFTFWNELVAVALQEPGLFAFTFLHWHPRGDGPHVPYIPPPYWPRSLGPIPADPAGAEATFAAAPDAPGPYVPTRAELQRYESHVPEASWPQEADGDAVTPGAPDSGSPWQRAPRALGRQSHGRAARALVREVLEHGERTGALAPGCVRVGEGLVWGALVEFIREPAEEGAPVTDAEVLAAATVLWRALAASDDSGPRRTGAPPADGSRSTTGTPVRRAENGPAATAQISASGSRCSAKPDGLVEDLAFPSGAVLSRHPGAHPMRPAHSASDNPGGSPRPGCQTAL